MLILMDRITDFVGLASVMIVRRNSCIEKDEPMWISTLEAHVIEDVHAIGRRFFVGQPQVLKSACSRFEVLSGYRQQLGDVQRPEGAEFS
jgi:hypothetical protein